MSWLTSPPVGCGDLVLFFTPTPYGDIARGEIAHGSHLLESIRDGSNKNDLLGFLEYLSEICWLDVNFSDVNKKALAIQIAQWACIILESSSLEPGDILDATHMVFTNILPCGIIPVLSQQISWVSELGFYDKTDCLGCLLHMLRDLPAWMNPYDFDELSGILPRCIGQDFFQTLCTTMIETTLLGIVWFILDEHDVDLFVLSDVELYSCKRCDGTHDAGNFELDPFPRISDHT